jgi:hypothetical protein
MPKPNTSAFVIMPFSEEFRDIYELGIKAACHACGVGCTRVDEQIFLHSILDRIYEQIAEADIVISELTGRNPNVFYETGYAHGLKKAVIFLTKSSDDIPFDLRQYPHVVYGNSIAKLKSELEKRVRYLVENPSAGRWRPAITPPNGPNQDIMTQHIINYLAANDFTMVSFDRIRKNINAQYSDELLFKLIDEHPDRFRRAKLKGGVVGLAKL